MEGDMRVTKLLYILWVSDMGRAIAFYRDSMGLTLRSESPSWSELTCGDATLALHISHNGGIGATGSRSKSTTSRRRVGLRSAGAAA